jgi:hypothetical protein
MGGGYSNGYIPPGDLVVFNTGVNRVDGAWYWGLPPATYARHTELLRLIRKHKGRDLQISDGWGAYRPYHAQVKAREIYGNGAAWPGTSSHGGYWEDRQTMAMDYSNWGEVFDWNRGEFYEFCRAVGLTPGLISEERGYPDEPWHVVDLNPWSAVPSFEGDTDPTPKPKEVDMIVVHAKDLLPNWRFVLGPGYIKNVPGDQGQQYAAETTQGINDLDNSWLMNAMWTHGLGEVFPSGDVEELQRFLLSLENGAFYVASWNRSQALPVVNVDLDEDKLAVLVREGLSIPTKGEIAKAVRSEFREDPLK